MKLTDAQLSIFRDFVVVLVDEHGEEFLAKIMSRSTDEEEREELWESFTRWRLSVADNKGLVNDPYCLDVMEAFHRKLSAYANESKKRFAARQRKVVLDVLWDHGMWDQETIREAIEYYRTHDK